MYPQPCRAQAHEVVEETGRCRETEGRNGETFGVAGIGWAGPAHKTATAPPQTRPVRQRQVDPKHSARCIYVGGSSVTRPSQSPLAGVPGAIVFCMTAKEKILEVLPRWTEHDAEVALHAVEAQADPVVRRLDNAPLEDEEISPEEEAAVQEARDELAAGAATISHEEIKREFGIE